MQDTSATALALCGGYGSGKTFLGALKLIQLGVENPGIPGGCVGPTWRQMERDIIPETLGLLRAFGYEPEYLQQKRLIFVPSQGLHIELASGENPESIVGANWGYAVINEPGIQAEAVKEKVESRVRHKWARLRQTVYVGTPEGFNWWWEMFVGKPKRGYRLIKTHTADNPTVTIDYLRRLYAGFDPRLIAEKVEGGFVNVNATTVYYAFDRNSDVRPLRADPDLPFFATVDFNVDPFVALIGQQVGEKTRWLQQIVLHGARTWDMARALRAALDPVQPEYVPVYPDASGGGRRTSAAESDLDILREEGFHDLRYDAVNPPVRDRVAAFNGRLCNALGQRRTEIDPSVETLLRDLEQVTWSKRTGDIDKTNIQLTHASDQAGYYYYQNYPVHGGLLGGAYVG